MMQRYSKEVFILIVASLVITVVFCSYCGASLSVEVKKNGHVVVVAHEELISDVLKGVAAKTGQPINVRSHYDEPVSCQLEADSVENIIVNLLADWNHALFKKKSMNDKKATFHVWIYKKNPYRVAFADKTGLPPIINAGKEPDLFLKKFRRDQFAQIFKGLISPGKYMKTIALDNDSEIPGPGFIISQLDADSPLAALGLVVGDIVKDVDGVPVNSVEELVHQLSNPDTDLDGIIKIEIMKSATLVDPIHIQLL